MQEVNQHPTDINYNDGSGQDVEQGRARRREKYVDVVTVKGRLSHFTWYATTSSR
jgi:hypothetical protein